MKYFNSHSPRLWFWRAGLRTRIANRLQAERNARCRNNGRKIPDWGTAKVPEDYQYAAWIELERMTFIADTSRSPMLAAMATHEIGRLENRLD